MRVKRESSVIQRICDSDSNKLQTHEAKREEILEDITNIDLINSVDESLSNKMSVLNS